MQDELTDIELIESIQEGGKSSSTAIQEIISRHSGIFIDIINHYVPCNNPFCNKDELIEDKCFYIYKAAMKYDPNRGTKFSTHLGNEAKWLCLNTYNKNKNKLEIPSSDTAYDTGQTVNPHREAARNESYRKILEIINGHPDDRVKKIFNMRYIEGEQNKVMPWKRISAELEMSIQGCINIHNSTVKKIKTKLKKEC
jgi:RNA polymerase sigma factor (sigma-70 family)